MPSASNYSTWCWVSTLRWKDVQIVYGAFKSDDPKQIVVRCTLSVTSVELYFTGTSVEPPQVPPVVLDLTSCTTASIGSQLRVLNVCDDVKWLLPERRDGLHLPNLRELSFSTSTDPSGDLDDTLAVLSACPNILTLSVSTPCETRSASLPSSRNRNPTVSLPHLTRLMLSIGDGPTTHRLLRNLVCPSLRCFIVNFSSLAVDGSEKLISAQDLHNFANFLSLADRHPPLAELRFLCYTISPTTTESYSERAAALRNLLSILNGLERLTIWGLAIDNEFIESLVIRTEEAGTEKGEGSSTSICPSLSSLSFFLSENPGLPKESVEAMIVSRWKANKTLREVSFLIPGFENLKKESERVKACVDEGMVLRCLQSAIQA